MVANPIAAVGPASFRKIAIGENITNTHPAPTECTSYMHLLAAKVFNLPSFMRQPVAMTISTGFNYFITYIALAFAAS